MKFFRKWCGGIVLAACAFAAQPASAYLGGGYLKVPGVQGQAKDAKYKNWIRVEAYYWKRLDVGSTLDPRTFMSMRRRLFYSGPAAPQSGGDQLAISLSKKDPVSAALLAACQKNAHLPEVTFAESADLIRPTPEVGERPSAIPAWFEYKLKNVEIGCPVVAGAPEQAFTMKFSGIEWLNYKGPPQGVPLTVPPASLPPLALSGKVKTFVLSWVGGVTDADGKACPVMNERPTEKDYLAYMTPADAQETRKRLAASGGALDYAGGTVSRRGPGLLSVAKLPGIVPANAFHLPVTNMAYGLDLDGDGGKRASRPDVPYYRNYTSPDGRKGIDNQFYAVTACVEGMKGRRGFLDAYGNEEMRNGVVSILLTISGIDDDRNDDSIDITFFYSKDPMTKNAAGKDILPDYSFRITQDPVFATYMKRMHGRIVNGVIETDPVETFSINRGNGERPLHKVRLRLEIAEDGSLKGLLGGYLEWRPYFTFYCSGQLEHLAGLQCPGAYQAFKKAADGLKNPETGEYDGISMAYEMEGRAAMIPPSELASYFSGAYARK